MPSTELINLDLYTAQNSSNIKEKYFLRQTLKEFLPVKVSLRSAKNKFFNDNKNNIDKKLRSNFYFKSSLTQIKMIKSLSKGINFDTYTQNCIEDFLKCMI